MIKDDKSKLDAQAALDAMNNSQQALLGDVTPSAWISAMISLSLAVLVVGYGNMEHENNWALAIWLGGTMFFIFAALYMYSCRLKGLRVRLCPRSASSGKIDLIVGIILMCLIFASRFFREDMGLSLAPYVCGIASGAVFYYFQRKYPTGEVEVRKS